MIREARAALVALLDPIGIPVHDAWPRSPALPCLVVVPGGGTYLGPGETYGAEYVLSLDVLALVPRDITGGALARLDGLIEAVLAGTFGQWAVTGVEAPSLVAVGQQQVLGCVIALAKAVRA